MPKLRRAAPCALAFLLSVACAGAAAPSGFVQRPAEFEVLDKVVNRGLEAFTVTVPAFGNSLNREGRDGFEPVVFRTQLVAGSDAPDRITPADPSQLSDFNTWGDGYLDGATVRVYRIVDGKLRLVRRDTVTEGGCHVAGWNFNAGKILPADATRAEWSWPTWSRPGTTEWFTVMAVDKAGNTTPGEAVALARPDGAGADPKPSQAVPFRPDRKSDDRTPPPPPANVRAWITPEKNVELAWDAPADPDIAGYTVAQSDVDPARHRGAFLQLAEAPADADLHIRAGDLVIVEKEFRAFDPALLSNRVGNLERIWRDYMPDHVPNGFPPNGGPGRSWTLRDHETGTPVSEPGRTYFEMTLPEGSEAKIGKSGIPDISGKDQEFYPVPKPVEYKMEVWMKADRPDAPPVTFEADGDAAVGGFLEPFTFQPTTTWQKFEHTFTGAPARGNAHAYLVLTCRGPATYSVDNFRIHRTDAPYLGFEPEAAEKFKASGMRAIRTHGPIKTGRATYSMEQFTNPGGVNQGVGLGNTLPQQLAAIASVGAEPWLQVEYHMGPDEWLGFIEFLAAPYDPATDSPATKPWAAKRWAQGRKEPWTDAFQRIYFELSNETWNNLFAPCVFPPMPDAATGRTLPRGEVYAKMQDHVAEIFRSSPYWTPRLEEKFVHVLGGWANPNATYSGEAVRGEAGEFLTIAAYNGGWDEGEGPPRPEPASFFNLLSHVNSVSLPRSLEYRKLRDAAAASGRRFALGTYEAGPGYALDGLNNEKVTKDQARDQELVMKSKAAGTATLDSFLAHAANGFTLQNFFTFDEGDYWKSHAKWWRGGQPHPPFLALTLFNNEACGDMLETRTLSVSTADLPALKRREGVQAAPLAAVYATRRGDRVALFCLNRQIAGYPDAAADGFTPFSVRLPFTKAGKVTLHRLSGQPSDHNIEAENVRIETIDIPADAALRDGGRLTIDERTGGTARGLGPAEVFLYVFEGTNIPPEAPAEPPAAP